MNVRLDTSRNIQHPPEQVEQTPQPEDPPMDFVERATLRLKHWMDHNEKHREEYAGFAAQLEQAGKQSSAVHLREMADLAGKSNDCLRKALKALES
jgi:hypothetical protein